MSEKDSGEDVSPRRMVQNRHGAEHVRNSYKLRYSVRRKSRRGYSSNSDWERRRQAQGNPGPGDGATPQSELPGSQ